MFSTAIYRDRRAELLSKCSTGLLLFMGNEESPMNYQHNTYPFRQDSNFLYYFGLDQPNLLAIIDTEAGTITIYGNELSMDDIVWTGPQTSIATLAQAVGVEQTAPLSEVALALDRARQADRPIHYLPPYRAINQIKLQQWLDVPIDQLEAHASEALIEAVIEQRACKGAIEIAEMERALQTTAEMHLWAMRRGEPGIKESVLSGGIQSLAIAAGGALAYPAIVTVNGQTLHNHYHGNTLQSGQLVLGDFGAETDHHYAADITRTFPVDGVFTEQQKAIYQIVLDAEVGVIEALAPGVNYLDMHLLAARIIVEGLQGLGLMKGAADAAVAAGAHALFFPHGLGHLIGLDVHDMEDLGEDRVGYGLQMQRSTQFGLNALRLARQLKPGFVLTVEPGIYFIPELIEQWQSEGLHQAFINYAALSAYSDFGGIRIEDNVLITTNGARVLGPAIPKTIEEVEAACQQNESVVN
ncbi:MAG: aminopeptidase P family protein [Bacteroidota bacterium]